MPYEKTCINERTVYIEIIKLWILQEIYIDLFINNNYLSTYQTLWNWSLDVFWYVNKQRHISYFYKISPRQMSGIEQIYPGSSFGEPDRTNVI